MKNFRQLAFCIAFITAYFCGFSACKEYSESISDDRAYVRLASGGISIADFIATVDNSPLYVDEDSIFCNMVFQSWSDFRGIPRRPLLSAGASATSPGEIGRVSVGDIYVAGIYIPLPDPILDETGTHPAILYVEGGDSLDFAPNNIPAMGTYARYSIQGNPAKNIDSFSTTMYTPIPLDAQMVNITQDRIDRDTPLSIFWNRDPGHPTGKTTILISCVKGFPQNKTLITNNIYWWDTYIESEHSVNDTVSVQLPVSVLHTFPPNSEVSVMIVRGCRKFVQTSNGWCSILAYSYAMENFSIVSY